MRLCSGAVIAPRAVLTAKHCVYRSVAGSTTWEAVPRGELSVRTGTSFRASERPVLDTAVREVWRRITPPTRWFDQELPPGEEPTWPTEPLVIPVLPFAPGDAVTIVGGAFAGKPARFVAAVLETTRLRVEVSIFGQTAAVEIEASEVELPVG